MKLKTFLITASLWMGLLGLTACGDADVRTYQYPETAVLLDDLHIKKTIYSGSAPFYSIQNVTTGTSFSFHFTKLAQSSRICAKNMIVPFTVPRPFFAS